MFEFSRKTAEVIGEDGMGWLSLDVDDGEWVWSPLWLKPKHDDCAMLKSCLNDDLFEL
jgi:hypothetical protein